MTSFKDAAVAVLSEAGKALHVKEITKRAIAGGHIKTEAKDPSKNMWVAITEDIKKSAGSKFVKTAGSTYKLRSPDSKTIHRDDRSLDPTKPETTERGNLSQNTKKDKMHKQRLGAAGEHRVISELLLNGYDADRRTIDDGVDILAEKDGCQFYIQVKTVTGKGNKYTTTIKKTVVAKRRNLQMYYVFVMRNTDNAIEFVTLPSKELNKRVSTKKEHTASYTVHLSKKGDKVFLGEHDVTDYRNDWDL